MEPMDQVLGEPSREKMTGLRKDSSGARPDLGSMAKEMWSRMTVRRSDRKERDTSRASRR